MIFANHHVVELDHFDGDPELGEDSTVVVEEGLLAREVAGQRAPARA
jgi:hypothetical protein